MATSRSQTERSRATKAALVDAAILLLVERGWGATTSVAVCEVADVTRGALHHHYADLGELLSDALEKLCDELLPPTATPATSVLQLVNKTWSIFSHRRFKAVMEAWWAAGNSPEIARTVRPVMSRIATLVSPDKSHVPHFQQSEIATFISVSREAMLGLAMGRATNGGKPLPHEKSVLKALRDQAYLFDCKFLRSHSLKLN